MRFIKDVSQLHNGSKLSVDIIAYITINPQPLEETEPEQALSAVHVYEQVPSDQPEHDVVGRPIIHRSAYEQATGEASYIDDLPERKGQQENYNSA